MYDEHSCKQERGLPCVEPMLQLAIHFLLFFFLWETLYKTYLTKSLLCSKSNRNTAPAGGSNT
jgi:hypothetical protein